MRATPTTLPLNNSRKMLIGVYASTALVALVLTWRNSALYLHSPTALFTTFWSDSKANNATRFIAVDILWFGFAAAVWMVIEARKRQIRFVWAYTWRSSWSASASPCRFSSSRVNCG